MSRKVYAAVLSDGTIQVVHSTLEEIVEHTLDYAEKLHKATGRKLVCLMPVGDVEEETQH